MYLGPLKLATIIFSIASWPISLIFGMRH